MMRALSSSMPRRKKNESTRTKIGDTLDNGATTLTEPAVRATMRSSTERFSATPAATKYARLSRRHTMAVHWRVARRDAVKATKAAVTFTAKPADRKSVV